MTSPKKKKRVKKSAPSPNSLEQARSRTSTGEATAQTDRQSNESRSGSAYEDTTASDNKGASKKSTGAAGREARASREGSSGSDESAVNQPLVWKAVFIGAAAALVLVLVPSYLAVPRLTRGELTAVDTDHAGKVVEIARAELPPFAAGVTRGPSIGDALVALPSQKRMRVYALSGALSGAGSQESEVTASTDPGSSDLAFVPKSEIAIDSGPVVVSSSPSLGVALVIENSSSDIRIIDLSTLEITRSVSAGRRPVALAISDERSLAAVANLEGSSVTLIDLVSYSTKEVEVGGRPRSLAFFGQWLLVAKEGDKQLAVVDVLSATKAEPIEIEVVPEWLEVCGGLLIAADAVAPRIAVTELSNPKRTSFVETPGRARILKCLGDNRIAAGIDRPTGISLFSLDAPSQASTPTVESVGFAPTSASPTFLAEISPGIVAATGARPLSSLLSTALISANLFGVLVGGFVSGILARRRYGVHALAVSAVLVTSYWLVFQGAQPAALPLVLVFVGIPVLATAASGALISKVAIDRFGFAWVPGTRSDRATQDKDGDKDLSGRE